MTTVLSIGMILALVLSIISLVKGKQQKSIEVQQLRTEKNIASADSYVKTVAYNELYQFTHKLSGTVDQLKHQMSQMDISYNKEISSLKSEFEESEIRISNELRTARMERNQLRNDIQIIKTENRLLRKELRKFDPSNSLLIKGGEY
jgi:hypothetical protein